jgi:lysosomal acid lipase/cholesteryl ester hydrolase
MSFDPERVGTEESVTGRFTESDSFVYNLKNVNVPVAIFCGDKDDISTPEDVRYLKSTLPNVVHVETIRNYGHMDFVYASNARTMLNNKIMNLLRQQ